jgi:hypothetical protein
MPSLERKAFNRNRVPGLEPSQQPIIGNHTRAGHRGLTHAQLS